MAYFNQEKKATIQPAIKALLKKYGLNGSLSVRHGSTVVLTVKSGSIDFIADYFYSTAQDVKAIDVNVYHYRNHFTGAALEFLDQAIQILNNGNYDNSRPEVDYFDRGHYVDVNIGKWNQPYQLV
jgi:hypothetical protein